MFKKSASSRKRAFIVSFLAVLVSFSLTAAFVYAVSLDGFPVNSNGLSYGSAVDVRFPSEEPDLILAQATNGQEGYVYKTDRDIAEGLPPESPEAAVALMRERAENSADAFIHSIKEQSKIDLSESRAELIEVFLGLQGACAPFDVLPVESQALFLKALPVNISTDIVAIAWDEARAVNYRIIPVYKVDGKTVIGELIIG